MKDNTALNPFPLMLFACGADKTFAQKVAEKMGLKLEEIVTKDFSDSDFLIHQKDTIRDRNLFVICQPRKGEMKYRDLMECFAFVYSLRQGSPKSWITIVIPYLPFSRQDKPSNLREPILAQLIPILLQAAGANQIVVTKLHNPASRTVYPLIKMEDVDTTDIMIKYIRDNNPDLSNIMLAAPDVGATKSVRVVAEALGVPIVIVDKRRDAKLANKSDVMEIIGDPSGYDVILLDDIADTGGTLRKGAEALREKGAKKIHGMFTHAVLSGNAIENLKEARFESIVLTNSCPINEEGIKILPNCEILDLSKYIGQIIANLHNGDSVESLWQENGKAKVT